MPPTSELLHRLRSQTSDAHARLESSLDLLRQPPCLAHLRATLEGFYGFHLVWEPAVEARLPGVMTERRRLGHLAADLVHLGASPGEIGALPRCHAAARLTDNPATALGSLYVMEGSTLGGLVIAKALQGEPWAAGLSYFNPYGRAAAARWRQTQELLQAASPLDDAEVVEGAVATFELLQAWLAPAEAEAA